MECREYNKNIINLFQKKIKNYYLNKFRKEIYNNIYINKLNNALTIKNNDNRFDVISEIICNKNTINEFNKILDIYYKYFNNNKLIKINTKNLLSLWMIFGCSNFIIEDVDTLDKIKLLEYSNKLINEIKILYNKNLSEYYDIILFNKLLLKYNNFFILFIEQDKINKINYFKREWMTLEKSRNLILESNKYDIIQKKEILLFIDKDKKMVEKHMKIFNKKYNFENLKLIIKISLDLSKKIIEEYKQTLYHDINNNIFNIFKKIINDIKSFLSIFYKNKKNEYDDKIDCSFYIQLIKTNSLDMNILNNLGDYIINEVISLASVSLEQDILNKWNELKNNNNNNINMTISIFLIFILETIDEVKKEINDYQIFLELLVD